MDEREIVAVRRLALVSILILTAIPTGFRAPRIRRRVGLDPLDFVLNVALYIPLGFGLGNRGMASAVGRGMALSGLIECAQLFYRRRFGTALDVVANTTGTAIGAAMFRALSAANAVAEPRDVSGDRG